MNHQRCYTATEPESSTNFFICNNELKSSTDEDASTDLFEGYDAEYSDDERFEALHKSYEDYD